MFFPDRNIQGEPGARVECCLVFFRVCVRECVVRFFADLNVAAVMLVANLVPSRSPSPSISLTVSLDKVYGTFPA